MIGKRKHKFEIGRKEKKIPKNIITARGMEIDESRAIINKQKKSLFKIKMTKRILLNIMSLVFWVYLRRIILFGLTYSYTQYLNTSIDIHKIAEIYSNKFFFIRLSF